MHSRDRILGIWLENRYMYGKHMETKFEMSRLEIVLEGIKDRN